MASAVGPLSPEPPSRTAPAGCAALEAVVSERLVGRPHPHPVDLEARLVALARSGAGLRRALASVAGRMVTKRGWERLGFVRARDYAVERAGVSGRQLQELARMDRSFAALPALAFAFARGQLSWTKARLLARVATKEDEAQWLEQSRGLTARALSREVRAVDARAHDLLRPETDEEGEEIQPKETVFVHCTPVVRAKWQRARFLASRMEGRPIPAWAVAERVAAEALSAIPLDPLAADRIEAEQAMDPCRLPGEGASANGCVPQASRADPLVAPRRPASEGASASGCVPHASGTGNEPEDAAPSAADLFLAGLLEGLDEADAFGLDERLRRALEREQRLEAEMGPALLAVARGRLYRSYGCESLGEFARERLGMSPRKAEALVRLERAAQRAPVLGEAYRAGRLSWVQAQMLLPIVKSEASEAWRAAWVAHAERISVRRLEDEVSQAVALGRFEPPPLDRPDGRWGDGRDAAVEPGAGGPGAHGAAPDAPALSTPTGAPPSIFGKTVSFFFTAPPDVARLFRGALASVQRRIEQKNGRTASESEALDAMLEHAFETWNLANAELQREHRVFERDGWRCTFPACTSYGNLHDHHLEYRSWGGSDDLSNRTSLCLWHHLRGEHAKIVRCRGRAPGRLRFDLGARPGRRPLARYRSGDVRMFDA